MGRRTKARRSTLVGAVDEVTFEVAMKKAFSESTPSDEECELIFLLLRERLTEILGATSGNLQFDEDGRYQVVEQLPLLAERDGEKT